MESPRPLAARIFKLKSPVMAFFCPLCRSPRELMYGSKLRLRHYGQIALCSVVLMALTHSVMKERIFFWPLVIWAIHECVHKMFFRKEIPCPHCGFDATWYKKDVRVSRKLVQEFWDLQKPKDPPPAA